MALRSCIVCGCTDDHACEGGCAWTRILSEKTGICSQCPEPVRHNKLSFRERDQRRILRRNVRSLAREQRQLTERLMQIECDLDVTIEASREFEIAIREKFA